MDSAMLASLILPTVKADPKTSVPAGHIYVKDGDKTSKVDTGRERDVPLPIFEILPNHNLRRHPKSRPHSTRFRKDMDVKERGKPKQCTVANIQPQPIKFSHRVYVTSQSSYDARLEDDE
ncbi:hypothetical protein GOBAR_DD16195 [Gossypium barbadense]|nr:hypothetical protein GOBAR_DD16195 [Gossypium barbadense]